LKTQAINIKKDLSVSGTKSESLGKAFLLGKKQTLYRKGYDITVKGCRE